MGVLNTTLTLLLILLLIFFNIVENTLLILVILIGSFFSVKGVLLSLKYKKEKNTTTICFLFGFLLNILFPSTLITFFLINLSDILRLLG